ncbi:hypothetical protein CLOP_g2950, partial [Closterium sp. NIES-67]
LLTTKTEKRHLLQWDSDIAYRKGSTKIWVPNYPPLRQLLLEEYNDVLYAGHFGSNKTLTGIAKHYYWPHLAEDVQKFVTSCDTCQRIKSSKQKKAGLLQPLPVPEQPWQVVSLDFIIGLPTTTSGHDEILVVIDQFSKMGHFIPTHTIARTKKQHNSSFDTSSHSMAFQSHLSPTKTPSSPASSGRNLGLYSGPNSPCHPPTIRRQTDRPSASTRLLSNSSEQPARMRSPNGTCTCLHLPSKLRPRFCGPFLVEAQVTPITFRLRLPATWKIHNAFHVQLKPYRDPNTIFVGRQPPPPPPVLVQNEPEYEVESMLAHRHRRNGAVEILIRWKGYDPSEESWVPESDMGNARRPLHDY